MKFLISVVSVAMMFVFTNTAFAQAPSPSKGVIVANMNLSNMVIISETPNEIKIGFDLVNNGSSVQSDLRYGVDLIKKTSSTSQAIVDSYTSNEMLTVEPNSTLHRDFSYPVPQILSGTYDILVSVRTTGGLIVGIGSPGSVTLKGSVSGIDIAAASCYLRVENTNARYTLFQGVDVKPSENLFLVCSAVNKTGKDISVMPTFATHERSSHGMLVDMKYPDSPVINFKKGEKKEIMVAIPQPLKPQAYDVTVQLKENGKSDAISASVIAHFVVAGESATIQNITLDKTLYAAGDTINAQLNWSRAAHIFPGSRTSPDLNAKVTVNITITDDTGTPCSSPVIRELQPKETFIALSTNSLIACANPVTTVELLGGTGATLDKRVFSSGTHEKAPAQSPAIEKGDLSDEFSKNTPLVAGVLGILLLGIILLWKKKTKISSEVMKSLLFAVMLSSGLLLGAGKAEAALTFTGYDADGTPTVYTINTDKTTYAPGEQIVLSEYAYFPTCGNAHTVTYIETLSGSSVTSYTLSGVTATTAYLPVPAVPPGDYNIDIQVFFEDTRGPNQGYTTASIPITIVQPNNPPTATITVPTTNITLNQYTSTTLTGTGSDPDSGDSITAYEWRENSCSAGTLLSTLSSFSLSNPVAGLRTIYLRVKDAHNTWSTNCPSRVITVETCSEQAGSICSSPANACGVTNAGTIQCDGTCSAKSAPPNPITYGQSCVSSSNICGQTANGTYNCSGSCTAVTPPDSSCPAPICGNGICEGWGASPEDPVSCPADCKVKVKQF